MTFSELSKKFLAWCKKHQAPRTHEWYENYITMFNAYEGVADTAVMDLKPFQVQEWIDSYGDKWGNNYAGGAVVAIKRIYNWGMEQGYVESNPIARMKKASPKRRDIYMTPADYDKIMTLLKPSDPFKDLFQFVWFSGCRPQEARHIEARHIELEKERIVFPVEESKGKKAKRIIYVQGVALEIITRLLEKNKDGKIFRNTRDDAWTKYSICNRFSRLSKVMGKRLFCYASRHGFCQRKLLNGVEVLTLATLMGHSDTAMINSVYSHLKDADGHLKAALREHCSMA